MSECILIKTEESPLEEHTNTKQMLEYKINEAYFIYGSQWHGYCQEC